MYTVGAYPLFFEQHHCLPVPCLLAILHATYANVKILMLIHLMHLIPTQPLA